MLSLYKVLPLKKLFEYLPFKGYYLDWQCFLNLFGSHEKLPVILNAFNNTAE